MDTLSIRELMCPVDHFPRISVQAAFHEAIQALDTAHEQFRSGRIRQCILLVEDQSGKIISKISPVDALRALEPKYQKIDSLGDDIRFGLPQIFASMKDDYRLWQEPLQDLCRKAVNIKVESMLSLPGDTESIGISERMDNALHLFATTCHHSLFVIEDDRIVGVLLLSDVYLAICTIVKTCDING